MTLEERVEILHQSIESHNQQLGELTEAQAKNSQQIAELRISMKEAFDRMDKGFDLMEKGFERVDRSFERVQLNFDRFTTATLALTEHADDRARRIARLKGSEG